MSKIETSAPSINLHIESREQLLSALAEAAEIEHNLMCCYLYAMFSLKSSAAEGVGSAELVAIDSWRKCIRGIALEEMTHLTLVSNIISALGGTPHFGRPNFPISPGFFPAGIVIELTPFCMETLNHFIYLERPADSPVTDSEFFKSSQYSRAGIAGRLMPFGADYSTVGNLYTAIYEALGRLTERLGEKNLFCGEVALQIRPTDGTLPGLTTVVDLASAQRALDTIIIQGEGSICEVNSHFARFQRIRIEYQNLLEQRADFVPARRAAHNPVMRPPVVATDRLHIIAEPAASLIDLANSLYVFMLRMLQQVYSGYARAPVDKRILLKSSYLLMRAMVIVAERLTCLPANVNVPDATAGMSFAMIRSLAPLEAGEPEARILVERCNELLQRIQQLAALDKAIESAVELVVGVHAQLTNLHATVLVAQSAIAPAVVAVAPTEGKAMNNIEIASGAEVTIHFEGRRCIHARHCVLDLPQVFKANTPGEWIDPDAVSAEKLVALAEKCPSGAIRYVRSGGPQEAPPPVNVLNIRENGPLAIRAPIVLRGESIGYRATLCRCGRSNNKPYCDGSHVGTFTASGEPPTGDTTALTMRDGALLVEPQKNGPLEITGNLEICAGTGRTVARIVEARFCRCGNSGNKPFCDGSHVAAGFVAD